MKLAEPSRILYLSFGLGFTIIGMGLFCCHFVVTGLSMLAVGLLAGLYLNSH
jgi:hypothetical protein